MKRFIAICTLILVIILLYTLYANRNEIFLGRNVNRGGENIIYKVDGARERSFATYRESLIITDNQQILALNKNGKVAWEIPFVTKNPIMAVNGAYILVADRGGSDFLVIKDGRVMAQITASGDIFTAKVNSKGYVSLATTEDGYKSKISVYNNFGTEIYTWRISDNYVLDCEVSPDGTRLVAALFMTQEEKIYGSLAFVDIVDKKIIERPSYQNCIFHSVKYGKNGNVLAVSDTAALYYDKNGKNLWNNNFQGRTLQKYSFENNRNVIFIFQNSRNTSTLESYSMEGKLNGSLELGYEVKNISYNNDVIVAGGTRDLGVFKNAKQKTVLKLNSDIRWQGLMPDRRSVFVVHGNNIEIIKP
ncbi:hypothetical protein FACS189425_01720 [Clostridia bacterium]|nr:hypothetical protein FACS189425_01720 [Clostridia bacterium]